MDRKETAIPTLQGMTLCDSKSMLSIARLGHGINSWVSCRKLKQALAVLHALHVRSLEESERGKKPSYPQWSTTIPKPVLR